MPFSRGSSRPRVLTASPMSPAMHFMCSYFIHSHFICWKLRYRDLASPEMDTGSVKLNSHTVSLGHLYHHLLIWVGLISLTCSLSLSWLPYKTIYDLLMTVSSGQLSVLWWLNRTLLPSFLLHRLAWGIFDPPGIGSVHRAVEVSSLNHRTARDVPISLILNSLLLELLWPHMPLCFPQLCICPLPLSFI